MESVSDVSHRELELDGCGIFEGLHNDGCCAVVIAGEEFVDKLRVYAPRADAEEEAEAEPGKCPEDFGVLEMELCGRIGDPIRARDLLVVVVGVVVGGVVIPVPIPSHVPQPRGCLPDHLRVLGLLLRSHLVAMAGP